MSDTAIKFENVSKLYRLGTVGTGWLSHDIKRWWITSVLGKEDPYLRIGETNDRSSKGNSDYVYALKDIDFEVKQGDVLGIIGKNGAGKSTLLKLLSRVTAPTTGKIYTKGRIASLLEVGTGFHPELTGRENIYMNGTILGMKKWEIDKQIDEIIDFSGCERYLDTPVKRYSSGMTVRLGFAIAAHLNPEILVVDEVLAVGDAEFQKKAIGKMQDVSKGEGRTVLFVSHNMASIKALCHTGMLLENGCVKCMGGIKDVVNEYIGDVCCSDSFLCDNKKVAPGNDIIRIKSSEIFPLDGSKHITIETGVCFKLAFWCEKSDAMYDVNLRITTLDDVVICQLGKLLGEVGCKDSRKGLYVIDFIIPAYVLNAGKYKVSYFWGENQKYVIYEGFEQAFEIENTTSDMGFNLGILPGVLRLKNDFSIKYCEE